MASTKVMRREGVLETMTKRLETMTKRLMVAMVAGLLGLAACGGTSVVHPPPAQDTESLAKSTIPGTSIHCGYERWAVKTGADPGAAQVNQTPEIDTVAQLDAIPQPQPVVDGQKRKYPPQLKRLPQEMQVVTVTATLRAYTIEQDNDFHLVVQSGRNTIIAEIPNPLCVKGGPFLTGIDAARKAFIAKTGYNPPPPPPGRYNPPFKQTNRAVTITGVLFFDFIHGQYGVAPNGIEIHPVTGLVFG